MTRFLRYLSVAGLCALPAAASAHAFGQQYTLPLPLSFYFTGAAAALVASFVILGFWSTPKPAPLGLHNRSFRPAWLPWLNRGLGILGVLFLALTLATAFFGSGDFLTNPAPIFFWIVLLLAVPYASIFIGGLWERMNPFKNLVVFLFGADYPPLLRYPERLGYAPTLLLYFGLIWLELLSLGLGAFPITIGIMLLGYLALAFFGAGLFGVEAWFRYGDFLAVFFSLIGKFAPVVLKEDCIELALPAERLVREHPQKLSLLFVVLFMLSSTAFDGLKDTQPWVSFFTLNPFLLHNYVSASYVVLVLSPLVFFAFYAAAILLMKLMTRTGASLYTLLLRFAFSLIPIAIAYHVAHYFMLLVNESQSLIPLLSDPFGKGWNLFGTTSYVYNPGLIGAATVWYLQVAAIVGGHVIATYVAHRIALQEFSKRHQVIVGQLPMLALMVCYTIFGLWILSLPFAPSGI